MTFDHDDAQFSQALQALSGTKDSIRGTAALLLQALPQRSQTLLRHAQELASRAGAGTSTGVFSLLQRLIFVTNDALFSLQAAKQTPGPLLAVVPEMLSYAAKYATAQELDKLRQLCHFWGERAVVDGVASASLLAALSSGHSLASAAFGGQAAAADDVPPADDIFCPVGALPLLVRARGPQAPYTPLSREAVMAAPLAVPVEPTYLQARLQRFYEEMRAPEVPDLAAAASDAPAASRRQIQYDAITNTFADGSHASGSRGVHSGLGVHSADAADDRYETFRIRRGRRYFDATR